MPHTRSSIPRRVIISKIIKVHTSSLEQLNEGDNLIGAPRESRLKGASRDSKARVATQRRESRLKGATQQKGATQEKI